MAILRFYVEPPISVGKNRENKWEAKIFGREKEGEKIKTGLFSLFYPKN